MISSSFISLFILASCCFDNSLQRIRLHHLAKHAGTAADFTDVFSWLASGFNNNAQKNAQRNQDSTIQSTSHYVGKGSAHFPVVVNGSNLVHTEPIYLTCEVGDGWVKTFEHRLPVTTIENITIRGNLLEYLEVANSEEHQGDVSDEAEDYKSEDSSDQKEDYDDADYQYDDTER
ncbi:unnamed protein product [Caenorhabditis nigoni]